MRYNLNMKALVISDTHFGTWQGNDLLRHEFALEALAPHMQGTDEVVLLGDIFELCFQNLEKALEASVPFLDFLKQHLQGGKVVFVPGNHDHHIVTRSLEDMVELKMATGKSDEELRQINRRHSFIQPFLERHLKGVEVDLTYPSYNCNGVLCTHGHYMDIHWERSLPYKILSRASWRLSGSRQGDKLTMSDYEALTTPMHEFYYQIAQQPKGISAQVALWSQLLSFGRFFQVGQKAGAGTSKALQWATGQITHAIKGKKHLPADSPAVAADTLGAPEEKIIHAFKHVATNLGWLDQADAVVFGHTHQPMDGIQVNDDPTRYYNSGSWFYDTKESNNELYLERAWPGTIVEINDSGEVHLKKVLETFNPLMMEEYLPRVQVFGKRVRRKLFPKPSRSR